MLLRNFHCADVTACGSLRIITTLEFFEHHFAKSGHEDLLVTRQYPHHIAIVHLHAREASAAERLRSSRQGFTNRHSAHVYGLRLDHSGDAVTKMSRKSWKTTAIRR